MKSNIKVLVISHNSFSKVYNNGKTLESLFGFVKKENIAQLFFCQNEEPDFSYCTNYYQITDKEVLLSLLKFNSKCGSIIEESLNSINDGKIKKKEILFNIAKRQAQNLVFVRDLLWKTHCWNTKALKEWCLDFSPDVIFFLGGASGFSHEIACSISDILRKPLVTYFTDDYLLFPKKRNLLDVIQRWRMKRFYKKTVKHSSLLFTIGTLMAQEYTNYFGRDFFSIMNAVSIKPYTPLHEKDKIIISYFGGLHLNRWKMIVRLAKVLYGANVYVFSIDRPSSKIMCEFEKVGVIYKGAVIGERLQKAISETTILLHVESDDTFNRSLTKLSVSTKIPEYLMSGRFVLGYGPTEVASMRLLADNNIGAVLSSSLSEDELKYKLNSIIQNREMRHKIGQDGYGYAVKNFDRIKILTNFTSKLESLVSDSI